MFWAVARHLPRIYLRFAYLSAPLISGLERNDRETANDTARSERRIVKYIRKLLLVRQTAFRASLAPRIAVPPMERVYVKRKFASASFDNKIICGFEY